MHHTAAKNVVCNNVTSRYFRTNTTFLEQYTIALR